MILPGVGAFIGTYRSALIDSERGEILPPMREISFNTDVRTDDGTLAHSIARGQRTTFEEGRELMTRMVGELLSRLSAEGRVELGRVGSLSKDSEGHLRFQPRYETDRLRKLSGLKSVGLNPAKKESPEEAVVASAPAVENFEHDPRYYYIRLPKRAVKVAAMFVAVVGLCLGFVLPHDKGLTSNKAQYASVVPVESIAASKSNQKAKPVKVIREEEPVVAAVPETIEYQETEPEEEYYLIIGTFTSERGAQMYIDMQGEEGLEVCGSRTGIWRVSAGRSANREELQARMNDKDFRNRYPGSWIWERK